MPLLVKICGITRSEDARAALDAGADALGFVFAPRSPRCLSPADAAAITRRLPASVLTVGVFVNAAAPELQSVRSTCHLDILQLHGDESPAFCSSLGGHVWKAFRVQSADSLRALPGYTTDAWLLDSYVPGQSGGTGAVFNWDLAAQAILLGRPVLLAGGLTPGNVAEAVRAVRPFGVDVSSGVEVAPGRKDPGLIREFIAAARAAGES